MKRALTITLAVALLGSLMFMGFAGTAAAVQEADQDADVEQGAYAETTQKQYAEQTNYNDGDQFNLAVGTFAEASSSVEQSNENTQEAETTAENTAEIEQEIEQEIDESLILDL